MMRLVSATAAVLLALSVSAFAQAPATTAKASVEGTEMDVLVDAKGMTLYTFTKDEAAGAGKSACNGGCAVNWPPLMAAADAKDEGDWTVVTRDDGTKMWAYKGKPLYLWIKDTKPGETTGHKVSDVWFVATP